MGVGVRLRENQRLDVFQQLAVGRVIHAHPVLFLHHVALRAQVGFVYAQRAHALGFQPQNPVHGVAGHGFVIQRAVEPGVGVVVAANLLDQARMLFRGHIFRAFEHQVLEQVGEPGLAARFVLAADPVPYLHRHHGRAMVFQGHDLQAVGQRRHLVIEALRLRGRRSVLILGACARRSYQRQKKRQQEEAPPSFMVSSIRHESLLLMLTGNRPTQQEAGCLFLLRKENAL